MAIPAVALTLLGNAGAQGQIRNNGLGGQASREIEGFATFVGDGATTSATLNFIDGVQKVFTNLVVLPVLAVTAPATIGGVANQAVYSGVGSYGQLAVGQSVTFGGFSNAGNNGTFTINALSTSSIQVTNAGSVAESNPAATVTATPKTSAAPVAVLQRVLIGPSNVLDTAAGSITCSLTAETAATGTVTFSAAPANGATCSVYCRLVPVV